MVWYDSPIKNCHWSYVCRWETQGSFHQTALLLDAGADHVFDAAISQYKAMTSYLKWEDLGIICVPNMEDKGSMKESSKLGEVIQLAKSIK